MLENTESQLANTLVQTSLLGEAVDAADLAILVSDDSGRCIAVNRQACAMLGYTREELLQLGVADFVPDADHDECYRHTYASGETRGVAETVRSDGTPLSVRYWSTPTRVARMQLVLSLGRPETVLVA